MRSICILAGNLNFYVHFHFEYFGLYNNICRPVKNSAKGFWLIKEMMPLKNAISIIVFEQTFTAFSPHSQVNFRNFRARNESRLLFLNKNEHILRHVCYIVAIVTKNSSQRCLLDFIQLLRFEYPRIFIPKSLQK